MDEMTDVTMATDAPADTADPAVGGGHDFMDAPREAQSIEGQGEGEGEQHEPEQEVTIESLQSKLKEYEESNRKMQDFITQLTQQQAAPSPEQEYLQGPQPQKQQQQPQDPKVGPGPQQGMRQMEEWLNISDEAIDGLIEGDREKFSKEVATQMDNRIGQALTQSVAMLGARMHEVVRQEMTMQKFQSENPHLFSDDKVSAEFYGRLNAARATNPNMPFNQLLSGVGVMMNTKNPPPGTVVTNPLTSGQPRQRQTQTPGFADVGKGFTGGGRSKAREHLDQVWGQDKRV